MTRPGGRRAPRPSGAAPRAARRQGADRAGGRADCRRGRRPHEARFIVDEVLGPVRVGAAAGRRPGRRRWRAARAMAARRAAGEPLQYVFGHWPFRGLDLRVDARVLIPRPETEQVVEVALGEARAPVARCGSGAGLVGGRRRHRRGRHRAGPGDRARRRGWREVWATDASADALEVAAANLAACRAVAATAAVAAARRRWSRAAG